jgi:hypothetical protein
LDADRESDPNTRTQYHINVIGTTAGAQIWSATREFRAVRKSSRPWENRASTQEPPEFRGLCPQGSKTHEKQPSAQLYGASRRVFAQSARFLHRKPLPMTSIGYAVQKSGKRPLSALRDILPMPQSRPALGRTPDLHEATFVGALSAQLRRPRSRSATAAFTSKPVKLIDF